MRAVEPGWTFAPLAPLDPHDPITAHLADRSLAAVFLGEQAEVRRKQQKRAAERRASTLLGEGRGPGIPQAWVRRLWGEGPVEWGAG